MDKNFLEEQVKRFSELLEMNRTMVADYDKWINYYRENITEKKQEIKDLHEGIKSDEESIERLMKEKNKTLDDLTTLTTIVNATKEQLFNHLNSVEQSN